MKYIPSSARIKNIHKHPLGIKLPLPVMLLFFDRTSANMSICKSYGGELLLG